MITIEECESRIYANSELMAQALNDSDFAGFLTCSYTPMRNDYLEFGQRVRDFIETAVEGFAEAMAKEMNAEQAVHEPDAAHESRLMDRDNAKAINAGRY